MTKFDSMLSETVISTKSNHQSVIDCGENLCTVVLKKRHSLELDKFYSETYSSGRGCGEKDKGALG